MENNETQVKIARLGEKWDACETHCNSIVSHIIHIRQHNATLRLSSCISININIHKTIPVVVIFPDKMNQSMQRYLVYVKTGNVSSPTTNRKIKMVKCILYHICNNIIMIIANVDVLVICDYSRRFFLPVLEMLQ